MDTHRPKQARPLPDPNPFPPSALSAALTALQCLNSLYASPVASMPGYLLSRGRCRDRGNPPPSPAEEEIEYDTYGWFNFDSDAEGVRRLDRQWMLAHSLAVVDAAGWKAARGSRRVAQEGDADVHKLQRWCQ